MAHNKLVLILLAVLSGSAVAVATNEVTFVGNFTGTAELMLGFHRLTNALYPFKNQIQSTWTRRHSITIQEPPPSPITCHMCNAVMPLVRKWLEDGTYTKEEIQRLVIEACKLFNLAPRPHTVCEPIIKAYTEQFLYIVANSSATANVTNPSPQVCGLVMPDCDKPGLGDWPLVLNGTKPPPVDREILPVTEPNVTKIIQFTDLHVDLHYVEGTNTDCGPGMPICCREYEGIPENESLRAGPYGDFHCALPINTLKLLYEHAKNNTPDARYVFLTGDYIHSGVWLYNEQENSEHVRRVARTLADTFTDPKVPIYPLVGNHEPQVVNMYPPKELWGNKGFSLSWLYHGVMLPFIERDPNFLPQEELDRFYEGGYYSVSPEEGLRLIVLNTNLCSPENFWLGYNDYPVVRDQLEWMAGVLWEAELAKESVLIVGHIEPGSCWSTWSTKFNDVVDRFQGIIRGSFFGHSHKPQYRVSMSKGTMNPVFASYIAGSGLPDLMHPAYSVFHVDGERGKESMWDVLRHELIILNLTESNSLKEPKFRKLADSYETFGLPNLTPNSIVEFAKKLICNQPLMDSYLTFHTKGEDTLDHRECDVNEFDCMSNILCNIVSSNAADEHGCNELKKLITGTNCTATPTTTTKPTTTEATTPTTTKAPITTTPTTTKAPTTTSSSGRFNSRAVQIRTGYGVLLPLFITFTMLLKGFAK